jgi:pyridoxamine 5'-phosphate oxidase
MRGNKKRKYAMPDRAPLLSCYNDLPATLETAWQNLVRGAADRRSPFHCPAVGTCGLDGRPRLRTMILRAVTPSARLLRVHTDIRAEKWAELSADPRIALHFYDQGMKVQIRLEGVASLHHGDDVAQSAWAASQRMSRACYATMPAPGSTLSEAGAFTLPDGSEESIAPGEAHFGALAITVQSLEWLYLAHQGHRRARFAWDEAESLTPQWLVP